MDWEHFRRDVFARVDAAWARRQSDEDCDDDDDGQRGSLTLAARKVKEAVQQTLERTGNCILRTIDTNSLLFRNRV